MKKYIPVMCLAILIVVATAAKAEVGVGKSGDTSVSTKTGAGASQDLAASEKQMEQINRQIGEALSIVKNEKISTSTQISLQMVREMSTQMGITQKRNLAADILLIMKEEFLAVWPSIKGKRRAQTLGPRIIGILSGFSPNRYGWSSAAPYGIPLQTLQGLISKGESWGRVNRGRTGTLKKDIQAALYFSASAGDCLSEVSVDPGQSMEEILVNIRLWVKDRAALILTSAYKPSTSAYRSIWATIKDVRTSDVHFAGTNAFTYRVRGCVVDISSGGMFTLTCNGRQMLTTSALNGVSADVSFSQGYSQKQSFNDLKQIAQLHDLTKAVSDKVDLLMSMGKVKEASTTSRIYRDTVTSDEFVIKQNAKVAFLQKILN